MYTLASFFMLRKPVFPVRSFLDYINSKEDIIIYLPKQEYYNKFKEALLLSSKTLYDNLISYENNKLSDPRKIDQLRSGLLKYFSRSTTRPTPFGYFASIKINKINEINENYNEEIFQNIEYKKSVRPDMEWLYEIIKKAENSINRKTNIKIKINPSAYINGDRIILNISSKSMSKINNKIILNEDISIKNNSLTNYCLYNLQEWKYIQDFINELKNKFDFKNIDNIEIFLKNLINNGVILTELQPDLICSNVFFEFINSYRNIFPNSEYTYQLTNIKENIEKYVETPIGSGVSALENLYNSMNFLHKTKSPLQIDILDKTECDKKIDNQILNNLIDIAEFLLLLSPRKHGLINIREYHIEFLDRYGTAREIPIIKLLDEELGFGAPAGYKYPKSQRTLKQNLKYDERKYQLFFDKILQNSFKNENTVIIEKSDLEKYGFISNEKIPESIEIYAHVYENFESQGSKLVLSTNHGTHGACQTFGRFSSLYSLEEKNVIGNLIESLENRHPNIIFCELVYMPISARSANVSICQSFWKYKIYMNHGISGENILDINDIVVCADMHRLYLKSLKFQKEVVFLASHVMNFENSPNIIRFMRELSYERCKPWTIFSLGELSNLTYIPRIEYASVIILPQTWKLNKYTIAVEESKFLNEFNNWKKEWKVPDLVNLVDGDNRILLNLKDSLHLKELFKEYKNKEIITLQESFCQYNESGFVKEIVVPLISKKFDPAFPIPLKNPDNINHTNRLYFPGDIWFYTKLYINERREDEFISKYMPEFISNFNKEIDGLEWFYIRYRENRKHIRLRIKFDKFENYQNIILKYRDFCKKYSNLGLLINSSIDVYEPEIERYGGPDLIQLAEKIFMADSILAINILKNKKEIEKEYSLLLLSSFCIISILDNFGLNYSMKLQWQMRATSKEQFVDEFRENRKKVCSLFINNNLQWYKDTIFNSISNYLVDRDKEFFNYVKLMDSLLQKNKLFNSMEGIIGSFIHMQCNRIFGLNSELEKKSISFALHTLLSIKYHLQNI